MTPEEKFIFDLQGYIVVKNVLSQAEVDELNAIADQKMADQEEMSNGLKIPRRVSLWGKPFQNLFDHPNMIPYLSELLGPQFRADHDYGIFMRQGGRKGGLHGGDHRAGTHYYKYRDGVMRNGLTVVVYFLAPAPQVLADSAAYPVHTNPILPSTSPKRFAPLSAFLTTSPIQVQKQATPSSAQKRRCTAPCPGLLKTNAEPYSTNSPRATFPTRQHTTITTTTKT